MNSYRKKWWSRLIRERNYFGFRYWWFNWLLLLGACLAFYLLWSSAPLNAESCKVNDSLLNANRIIEKLDKCCPCRTEIPPADTNMPPAPKPDTIKPKPVTPPVDAKPCDANAMEDAGGYGVKRTKFVLGTKSGVVTINYDMKAQPDKLEVFYEGKRIASTFTVSGNEDGFVGGDNRAGAIGSLRFNYVFNREQHVTVVVTGIDSGTSWNYSLGCPK
jgi:hypothetical protein